ncbi:AAA-domain-containing protein [Neocallimastix lanati (nom. inval.)]|jgi:vesicle-fusing ATPase|uniref:Vesicular-fusion protein SEC18 n=1 Tax=Neocallimastix californiae TaxID=1754190 RepID=A0A1Y2DYJ5_9FUNG|nr:AAA-domain-containing protein [Neocallimastix sp. JGI-2020a]ORY63715.1 AAA-domain-containing protein [Neocallimastix californiae]|eukprot:ORY63715.1 AAA-domain-containing protein [Neocallimastix californiae]
MEARLMKILPSPDNKFALTNLVFVNPYDFNPIPHHILIDDRYALSISTYENVPSGSIYTNTFHRNFAQLQRKQACKVTPYDPNQENVNCYIGSMTIEIDFLRRGTRANAEIQAEDVAQQFIQSFNNQIFTRGQPLAFVFQNQFYSVVIKDINNVDLKDLSLNDQNKQSRNSQSDIRGILMKETQVLVTKPNDSTLNLKGSQKNRPNMAIIQPDFKFEDLGIGGLDKEFSAIFRRAFASRIFPPSIVEKLGIQHCKGILLYGPPGTGKTLMARQIGKMLNAREPIIVNGPEILNKYVGQSEENIRKLFAEAEKEYKARGDESSLHIIIFDELDAICRQRGGKSDGTGVGDSVVNQLLAKMDGVEQLNNILIIGMTNRKDMIDEALLRPGRLEVHMEISLPDQHGRVQILNIHTAKMRENHLLAPDVDIEELASLTKNFSGAEIAGFVRSASTFAFSRHIKGGTTATVNDDVENLKVCQSDFLHALEEVHPSFGVSDAELQLCVQNGIIPFSDDIDRILKDGSLFVEQVKNSNHTPLVSVLLHGAPGCGKTALAATIAMNSDYPFIKLITPENMVGYSEMSKMNEITKIFNDSYKSPLSVIVIDSLERLLDWVPIGPRFSNTVLQTLLVLLKKQPPKGHKLLLISTTSQKNILQEMDMLNSFDAEIYVPSIKSLSSIDIVLKEIELFNDSERKYVMKNISQEIKSNYVSIGVKKLLMIAEMARQDDDKITKFVSTLLMEPSMMVKDRY